MADIELRFDKDMLVLSTSMDAFFREHGFDPETELDYAILCEPELLEEEYRLESVMGTPVFVAPTQAITALRLAKERFDGRANEVAGAAFAEAAAFKPQHVIAAIGPAGLPLDASSKASLLQSRDQYKKAVEAICLQPYEGVYFERFTNLADAQCALMGARSVYDGPVFITLELADSGAIAGEADYVDLAEAAAFLEEYGASVCGIASGQDREAFVRSAARFREGTGKPMIAEVLVGEPLKRVLNVPANNPYYRPDTLLPLAVDLRAAGVQFLRAGGMAMPSYTGVLCAACEGLDVAPACFGEGFGKGSGNGFGDTGSDGGVR